MLAISVLRSLLEKKHPKRPSLSFLLASFADGVAAMGAVFADMSLRDPDTHGKYVWICIGIASLVGVLSLPFDRDNWISRKFSSFRLWPKILRRARWIVPVTSSGALLFIMLYYIRRRDSHVAYKYSWLMLAPSVAYFFGSYSSVQSGTKASFAAPPPYTPTDASLQARVVAASADLKNRKQFQTVYF